MTAEEVYKQVLFVVAIRKPVSVTDEVPDPVSLRMQLLGKGVKIPLPVG
jgi:hypothetical protein